ncbi:MAG: homoserine kinase [Bifidobacteriaceae bacterium]|nr:homoserine kinase [Bifidobacteriaceae bacterium]
MQYEQDCVKVSVPATSANLGPGFDAMGLSLGVRDEITVEALASPDTIITIFGEGHDYLPHDERHLIVQALRQTQEVLGLPQTGIRLEAHNRIPQSRGMGSSASAIVAGVAAAVAFSGRTDLDKDFIFNVAAQMEGHPDNVAPAVYGGLTVSWNFDPASDIPVSVLDGEAEGETGTAIYRPLPQIFGAYTQGFHSVRYPVDGSVHVYVFVPQATLSTKTARTVLPDAVPYADALRNVSRAALLPAVLGATPTAQSNALLFNATQDWLHQNYRRDLYPDSWQLMTHLRSRGYASTISGAGPCVLVLHSGEAEEQLRDIAEREWLSSGRWRMLPVAIDSEGVRVSKTVSKEEM